MRRDPVIVQASNPDCAAAEGARLFGLSPEEVGVTPAGPGRYTVAVKDAPGSFTIHLQSDRTAAFLEILSLPRGSGEPISLDQVLEGLKRQNITFGIDKEQIRQALDEASEQGVSGKNICIAKSREPEQGKHGRLELKVGMAAANKDPEAALMARQGQVLAVRIPAEPGAPGCNIFGEELMPRPVIDPPLTAGANVRLANDGLSYMAEIYGRVTIDEGTIAITSLEEIAEDRMTAWMPIYQLLADNSRLEMVGVTATLIAAGVVHGFLEEKIKEALAQKQPIPRLAVARATRPEKGKDAAVRFEFRLNGTDPAFVDGFRREGRLDPKRIAKELVLAGQVLATKTEPKPAVDGRTVTGEIIPGEPPRDLLLTSGENVIDDGRTFKVADTIAAGYADYREGVLTVTDPLRISEDCMQVLMEIHPPGGNGSELTGELVVRMLKQHQITHGVNKKSLRQAVAYAIRKKMVLHDVVIARGLPAVTGRDAFIDLHVSVEKIAGRISEESDNIDFRERNALCTVKKGAVLARKVPAEPGIEGYDVLGRALPADPGADLQFIPQPNVMLSKDGLTLTSEIDGLVSVLENNKIAVFQLHEIKGDVDYHTGNLEMTGALHISGWVRTGFKVRASAEIQISGGVEDAVVVSATNVLINGGVIRREHGLIEAGGTVNVRFLEGARVRLEGDIVVRNQILRSKIFSKGRLSVTTGRGQIRGGMTSASQGITANEIGSTAGVKTVVMAGVHPLQKRRLAITDRQLAKCRRRRTEVETVLGRFLTRDKEVAIPKEIAGKLSLLAKQRRDLLQKENHLTRTREELTWEMEAIDHKRIRITAKKAVYAGTIVVIGGVVHKVTEDLMRPTSFILDEESGQVITG